MNIIDLDKEVKAYDAKKNKLRNRFISRITSYLKGKEQGIKATNSAMGDLEQKLVVDKQDFIKATNIIKNL